MALNYGLWESNTQSFLEALQNTNKYMARLACIKSSDKVLDAGCGVGGAAIYLAKEFSARSKGISLSESQIAMAHENAIKQKVQDFTDFAVADFTDTNFPDASFDVIWSCESIAHATDKLATLREWHRLLKPGGRLIILSYFSSNEVTSEAGKWLDKWCNLWAMSKFESAEMISKLFHKLGFSIKHHEILDTKVYPTIKRMYRSYWLGLWPSLLYNFMFGARHYARNHYRSGLYQYKAFKLGGWHYMAFLVTKK